MSNITIKKKSAGKPKPMSSTGKPLNGTATGKKALHENSLIPGMEPEKVLKSGKAVYGEDQLEKVRKTIPNPPPSDIPAVEREKTVSQVELLMLKGITNQNVISNILKLTPQTCSIYVRMVHARWEVLGNPQKHGRTKGEALSKLTLIENELWTLYSNAPAESMKSKVSILAQLQNVVDRKLLINGLSPRMLEAEAMHIPAQHDGLQSPADMITGHQKSLGVLSKLLTVLKGGEDESTIIDAETC